MPINAKIVIQQTDAEKEAAAARPILGAPVETTSTPEVKQTQEPLHHEVVIGGKSKTIAKNSAYLLDMITVEK